LPVVGSADGCEEWPKMANSGATRRSRVCSQWLSRVLGLKSFPSPTEEIVHSAIIVQKDISSRRWLLEPTCDYEAALRVGASLKTCLTGREPNSHRTGVSDFPPNGLPGFLGADYVYGRPFPRTDWPCGQRNAVRKVSDALESR